MTNKLDCLKLINFIEKSTFFTTNKIRNKKLLIAFSGGQDSSCLLTIFYILSKKWDFKLGAVYCNHCWTDSTQTSLSAFETLQMFDIPFYFVESPNSEPMKPEQKARDWRYSSFYTISKWENYDFLLTGHTLSDCVETILFNLFRGSGLKGFFSLKEDQNFSNLKTNDFFFKKTGCFLDPFFYFSEKKGFPFFRKYRLFKNLSTLFLYPKLSFFVFGENCVILKPPYFLLKNKSRGKVLEFLITFGIKNISAFGFLGTAKKRNIKKNRLTNNTVPSPESAFSDSEQIVVNRGVKKRTPLITSDLLTKDRKVAQTDFLLRFIMKTFFSKKANPFFVFLTTKKNKKHPINVFKLYLQKVKGLQNTDKLTSFITIFKPFVLQKKSQKKGLTSQIQKLIKKKEKEKRILLSYLFKGSNKYKLISNQVDKKGLKLIKKFLIKPDKKLFSLLPSAALNPMQSFVFEQFEKTSINVKIVGKAVNCSPHFEDFFDKLIQKASVKKKGEFRVFRPLIKINRETLFLFANKLKIPISYDKSNKDLNITRNYIRKVLIPLLKKINPRVEENIYKFSKIIEFYYQLSGDLSCPSDRFDIFNP